MAVLVEHRTEDNRLDHRGDEAFAVKLPLHPMRTLPHHRSSGISGQRCRTRPENALWTGWPGASGSQDNNAFGGRGVDALLRRRLPLTIKGAA